MHFGWYLNNYSLYIPPLNCGMGLVIKLCKCGNISLSFLSDLLKLLENLVSPDCNLAWSHAVTPPVTPCRSLCPCIALSASSVYSASKIVWTSGVGLQALVAVVHSQVSALAGAACLPGTCADCRLETGDWRLGVQLASQPPLTVTD